MTQRVRTEAAAKERRLREEWAAALGAPGSTAALRAAGASLAQGLAPVHQRPSRALEGSSSPLQSPASTIPAPAGPGPVPASGPGPFPVPAPVPVALGRKAIERYHATLAQLDCDWPT